MVYYYEYMRALQIEDWDDPDLVIHRERAPHPCNCKTECPYGYGKAFCFPCMAKIMQEHNAKRKAASKKA